MTEKSDLENLFKNVMTEEEVKDEMLFENLEIAGELAKPIAAQIAIFLQSNKVHPTPGIVACLYVVWTVMRNSGLTDMDEMCNFAEYVLRNIK